MTSRRCLCEIQVSNRLQRDLESPPDRQTFVLARCHRSCRRSENPVPSEPRPLAKWGDKINGITLVTPIPDQQPKLVRTEIPVAPTIRFNNDSLVGPAAETLFLTDSERASVNIYSIDHTDEGYGFNVSGNGLFLSTVSYPSRRKAVIFSRHWRMKPTLCFPPKNRNVTTISPIGNGFSSNI